MDRLASMETFVRVVETGSFSGAARFLHLGQPAISKTIAQLEERLGVKLLARSTRGLSATEAGQPANVIVPDWGYFSCAEDEMPTRFRN